MINHDRENADEDDTDGSPACPYCQSTVDCPHLLLLVDKTFRTAEGGLLYEAFNNRWSELSETHCDDPDFDERECFDELLEEIEDLASCSIPYDHEGGPGMSSSYEVHYVSSKLNAQKAQKSFGK